MFDPESYRASSRAHWEEAAEGWEARRAEQQRAGEPVSSWMVGAIAPRPGQTVLELAAGLGDTGFMAAALLGPEGRLISTDGSEAMVAAAQRRSEELGLGNVEHRAMEAEWIDLATASVDAVLCRWGFMLLADPETALREARRVLRPGGRLALAVWAPKEENPWVTETRDELVARGLAEPAAGPGPGMFALAAPGVLEELLLTAGFEDVEVGAVDVVFASASFDDWWEQQFDLSPSFAAGLARATPQERDDLYDAIERRVAPWRAADGSLALPGRSLVASAGG